jgi:hypothetical protein
MKDNSRDEALIDFGVSIISSVAILMIGLHCDPKRSNSDLTGPCRVV